LAGEVLILAGATWLSKTIQAHYWGTGPASTKPILTAQQIAAMKQVTVSLAKGNRTKLGTNQEENAWFRGVARRYGLTDDEARRLHNDISKQGYSREEIEDMARDLADMRGNGADSGGDTGSEPGTSGVVSNPSRRDK
jgi:hypothetical protein